MNPDLVNKIKRASRNVNKRQLTLAAIKKEENYTKALARIMKQWQADFLQFYKRNDIGNQLYEQANSWFPAGRPLTFSKELDEPEFIDFETIDLYNGIWIYDSTILKNEQLKSVMPVDEALAGFHFDTGILQNTLDIYNVSEFNIFGNISLLSVGAEAAFSLKNKDILEAIGKRANLLSGNWADSTFLKLKDQITKSFFVEGKNPILGGTGVRGGKVRSVSGDILHFFDGNTKRARMVARTETACMQSDASFIFNIRSGIEKHGWMATIDNKTREEHRLNHGHIVKIGEFFPNGQRLVGEGSSAQVVNCRCTNYAVIEGETIIPWDGADFKETAQIIADYNLIQNIT